jgi:hypothetical protein
VQVAADVVELSLAVDLAPPRSRPWPAPTAERAPLDRKLRRVRREWRGE